MPQRRSHLRGADVQHVADLDIVVEERGDPPVGSAARAPHAKDWACSDGVAVIAPSEGSDRGVLLAPLDEYSQICSCPLLVNRHAQRRRCSQYLRLACRGQMNIQRLTADAQSAHGQLTDRRRAQRV